MEEVDKNLDLPLMANVDKVRVKHYMMILKFNFEKDIVLGEALLFLEDKSDQDQFREIVLDARHLENVSVHEVLNCEDQASALIDNFELRKDEQVMSEYFTKKISALDFDMEPWCIRVKPTNKKVIKISWTTRKEARSLLWRLDQNGHKSVFTAASAVNNRSLFPCQEPPIGP